MKWPHIKCEFEITHRNHTSYGCSFSLTVLSKHSSEVDDKRCVKKCRTRSSPPFSSPGVDARSLSSVRVRPCMFWVYFAFLPSLPFRFFGSLRLPPACFTTRTSIKICEASSSCPAFCCPLIRPISRSDSSAVPEFRFALFG